MAAYIDSEDREALYRILDTAETFEGLEAAIETAHRNRGGPLFSAAQRFIATRDASGLDHTTRERFIKALDRVGDGNVAEHMTALDELLSRGR